MGIKKYLIKNISASIYEKQDLSFIIAKKLKIDRSSIKEISIQKKSLDTRKKSNIKYNYTCLITSDIKDLKGNDVLAYKNPLPYIKKVNNSADKHPFVIGAGPAGLFAALGLVEAGYEPYIFERGESIINREKTVKTFWETGKLNTNSNVQFGEGGAGTFSDAKLTARNQDYYTQKIYDYLIRFGAKKDIKTDALPHLGTDKIREIITNIRNYLISKNTKFFYNSKLTDIYLKENKITRIKINNQSFQPNILILAVGNSARDTFELLYQKGINIISKPFAVGLRIEHKQDFINRAIYGKHYKVLGNASYRLTAKVDNRGIYSFCMCPGGYVVASASEKNMQVTNGMSFSDRNNQFANSAIVVTVSQKDFGEKPLDGIKFQRFLEQVAFFPPLPYFSPFQTALDFIKHKKSDKTLQTSYTPGIYPANFSNILPDFLSETIYKGLKNFDKKINGFISNGVLLGMESRTSSPIRILRDKESFQSVSVKNMYPVGEGSGYAGGIISSAADGYKLSQTFFDF